MFWKASHSPGGDLSALSMFSGIRTGARLGLGLPVSTSLRSNVIFAIPASVIRPSRINLSTRRLLVSDQLLSMRRGLNLRAYFSLSIFWMMLSIQPKHKASSTEVS